MTGKTHALIGLAAVLAFHPHLPTVPIEFGLVIGAGVLGALAPDVDSDESEIRQMTKTNRRSGLHGWLISWLMPSHRGVTHSLLVVALLWAAWWVLGHAWLLAFAIGYASHIAGDMLTVSGVPVLWPLAVRCYLLPRFLRFTTGTWPEYLLAVGVGVWLYQTYAPHLGELPRWVERLVW